MWQREFHKWVSGEDGSGIFELGVRLAIYLSLLKKRESSLQVAWLRVIFSPFRAHVPGLCVRRGTKNSCFRRLCEPARCRKLQKYLLGDIIMWAVILPYADHWMEYK